MNVDNGYYVKISDDPCVSGTWKSADPNATRRRFVETRDLHLGSCRPSTQQDCDKIMSCVSENGDIVLGENEESCASKNNTWKAECSDPKFNDSEESCKKGRLKWLPAKGFCYDDKGKFQRNIGREKDCKSNNTWSWKWGGSCSDATYTTQETCVKGSMKWEPSNGRCYDVPAGNLLAYAKVLDTIRTEAECKTNNTWTGGCSDPSKNASKSACLANNRTWKNTPMSLHDGKCTSPEVERASLQRKRDRCDRFWDHTTNTCRDFVPEDCGNPVTEDYVQLRSPLYYKTTRGHAKACRKYKEEDCNDGYVRDIVKASRQVTCFTEECENPTFEFVSDWAGCEAHTPHKLCNRGKFVSGETGCRPYTKADCTAGRPVFVSETKGCRPIETKESCRSIGKYLVRDSSDVRKRIDYYRSDTYRNSVLPGISEAQKEAWKHARKDAEAEWERARQDRVKCFNTVSTQSEYDSRCVPLENQQEQHDLYRNALRGYKYLHAYLNNPDADEDKKTAARAFEYIKNINSEDNRMRVLRKSFPLHARISSYAESDRIGLETADFEETSCVTKTSCEARGGETMPNGACAMFQEGDCGSEAPVFVSKEDGCRMWRPSDCSDGTFSSFKVTGKAKDTFQWNYGNTFIGDEEFKYPKFISGSLGCGLFSPKDCTKDTPIFVGERDGCRKERKSDCAIGDETLRGNRGSLYRGRQNRTISGFECQHWGVQSPNKHWWGMYNRMTDHHLEANFCRNPKITEGGVVGDPAADSNYRHKETIWCYVKNGDVTIDHGGSGYSVGDKIKLKDGAGELEVTSVDQNSAITSVKVLNLLAGAEILKNRWDKVIKKY